jgi:hypothetical protein
MEPENYFAHDVIDAFVARVFGWLRNKQTTPAELGDVAFSDEWERKQIARELHWN